MGLCLLGPFTAVTTASRLPRCVSAASRSVGGRGFIPNTALHDIQPRVIQSLLQGIQALGIAPAGEYSMSRPQKLFDEPLTDVAGGADHHDVLHVRFHKTGSGGDHAMRRQRGNLGDTAIHGQTGRSNEARFIAREKERRSGDIPGVAFDTERSDVAAQGRGISDRSGPQRVAYRCDPAQPRWRGLLHGHT